LFQSKKLQKCNRTKQDQTYSDPKAPNLCKIIGQLKSSEKLIFIGEIGWKDWSEKFSGKILWQNLPEKYSTKKCQTNLGS
jgi:hypothetical protein